MFRFKTARLPLAESDNRPKIGHAARVQFCRLGDRIGKGTNSSTKE